MPPYMRIVLDTNVLVMAARSRNGAAYSLVSSLPSTKFEIAVTIPLYMEYRDVLSRPEILKLGYTLADVDGLTQYLVSIAHKQSIFFLWRPWLKDPKDDMVLEAAFASRSEYIVTYNSKDFRGRGIEENFGIKPVTAYEFLKEMGEMKS